MVHSEIRTGPATSVNLGRNGQSDVTERKFGQQVFVEAYLLVNPVQIKVLMGRFIELNGEFSIAMFHYQRV